MDASGRWVDEASPEAKASFQEGEEIEVKGLMFRVRRIGTDPYGQATIDLVAVVRPKRPKDELDEVLEERPTRRDRMEELAAHRPKKRDQLFTGRR